MRLIQSTALYDLVVIRGDRKPSTMPITDEPSTEMRHLLQTDPNLHGSPSKIAARLALAWGSCAHDLERKLDGYPDRQVHPAWRNIPHHARMRGPSSAR